LVDKVLGRMEVLKGFIQVPTKSYKELIGDLPTPCKTLINENPARIDARGRLWSPYLKGKFQVGNQVQLIRTTKGFTINQSEIVIKRDTALAEPNNKTVLQVVGARKSRPKGTATSSFGSPGRFGHDSSRFYNSRLYEGLPSERKGVIYIENEIHKDILNNIFCKSSENMSELPDNSVHLMVTSPPYNVGKDYDKDFTLEEYRELLKKVFKEVYRVLVVGGRACVNIANLGRKPYIALHSWVIQDMFDIGFLMRGEIIWDKGASAAASTAWGSWCSASNPTLRDVHEYILIFSKDSFSRQKIKERRSTISREEFLEWSKSVWNFPAESATKVGHSAPFPIELPLRLIKLYTFENEIILDPFIGSGTTAIAALQTNRNYIGYDINEEYVKLAEKRIKNFQNLKSQIKITEFST
jgi:site-specific DNA-methyltransferase (adenine-specific)